MARLAGTIPVALAAAGVAVPAASVGQEPAPRDTTPADTLVGVVPDSVREVFAQERERRPPTAFPARLTGRRADGPFVHECDRSCVQSSMAFSLLELLVEFVPGIAPLRPGFFSGPHYALEGPYGPGSTRLFVDGREILPLEGGATDLRRLSLVYVDRVRVSRDAAGLVIDVTLRRHAEREAYSRISGGTGEPGIQVLDGIFANGLGSAFTVEGAFDLLDVSEGGVDNDRFEAWGRLSWVPGASGTFGLQLEYRSEPLERTRADTTELTRRQLLVRARGNPAAGVQLDAWAARESFQVDAAGVGGEEEPPERDVESAGLELAARPGPVELGLGLRLADGEAVPSLGAELRGALGTGTVRLEGSGRLERWAEFSTSEVRAALALRDALGLPVALRVDAATGSRGVPRPIAGTVDSVDVRAAALSGEIGLGPYRISGRYALQRVSRSLPFGAPFDSLVQAVPREVDVTSWEIGLEGPVVPIGALVPGLDPIRVRGFWRRNDPGDADALYLPERIGRAELSLHDTFFDGNLEIWLAGFAERRGTTRVGQSGAPDPVALSAYTWPGGHFMFQIGDFRFFWRLTNPTRQMVADVPGASFPTLVNAFGVRWEFFN